MLGTHPIADFEALVDLPLTPDGVLALRRRFYGDDNAIDIDEGATLFALARRVGENGCREWADFFREAISDLLVHQIMPEGYMSDAKAEWLIGRMQGKPALSTEFTTLLRVMELSRRVPDNLAAFALSLVKEVVLTGDGVAVTGERHEPGRVTRADVDALRRVLFVASSEGFGAVTRAEADVLFDIADATAEAFNDQSFADLFARAIGNHLLAGTGRFAPTRIQTLHRQEWLDQRRPLGSGIASTFAAMASRAFGVSSRESTPAFDAEERVEPVSPERVDADESAWLLERLERRPGFSEAERALLVFLLRECANLSPEVRDLALRAA